MRNKILIILFINLTFVIGHLSFVYAQEFKQEISDITKVDYQKTKNNFEYFTLETTDWVNPKTHLQEDKLIIDLPNTLLSKEQSFEVKDSSNILAFNLSQLSSSPEIARIVIDLKKSIDYDVVSFFGKNTISIEIGEARNLSKIEEDVPPAPVPAPAPSPVPTPIPVPKVPSILQNKIIVINPGHGGNDPGAISISGVPEKYLTLSTGLILKKLLEKEGAIALITRKKDVEVDYADIVDYANKKRADVFLGVHYNSSVQSKVTGTEIYYYTKQSLFLASMMHAFLTQNLGQKNNGIRRGMYYTIHHTNMPAIIIEPVYISNKQEEKLALSSAFQNRICRAIVLGLKEYFKWLKSPR